MNLLITLFFILAFIFVTLCFWAAHEINKVDRKLSAIAQDKTSLTENLLVSLYLINPLTHKQYMEYIRLHKLILDKLGDYENTRFDIW
jgi:hypothetical protein